MQNRGAELRLDIIADHGDPALSKLSRPFLVRNDEHRHAVEQADAGRQTGPGIALCRLLAADGQIAQHYLRTSFSKLGLNIYRPGRRHYECAFRSVVEHV